MQIAVTVRSIGCRAKWHTALTMNSTMLKQRFCTAKSAKKTKITPELPADSPFSALQVRSVT